MGSHNLTLIGTICNLLLATSALEQNRQSNDIMLVFADMGRCFVREIWAGWADDVCHGLSSDDLEGGSATACLAMPLVLSRAKCIACTAIFGNFTHDSYSGSD